MDTAEALRMVRALVDEMNPDTAARYGIKPILQEPETKRAIEKAGVLAVEAKRADRRKSLPAKLAKRWSRAEQKRLCKEFEQELSIHEIAELHGRTDGGIIVRLERLGKISRLPTLDRLASPGRKLPTSAGPDRPWLPQEDDQLCSEFHSRLEFEEIAGHLNRSSQAVVSRLTVLRKIGIKSPFILAG